ncbi:DNA-directed RNA polymerase subunit delta [Weissella diestrammenae]|uniref:Probable DNA-directed RNA polymerase subunit delta n=1 Tax=Weissella diestrammenae TaxID=1162633 RepID=A0A7G9T6M4_9LACO|nr:DNA-directed RNA polymerase subunit delta [Weissella diestrammenae]MCM0582967.1 DNA-directed RNA polymerase subunit delta [Weissella diestrammenae]QNN75749.1 DNA-directed RNA polymerase subunit delta [Weissella diestrammenae]
MALSKFDNQEKSELSMIEVAREILHERQETIGFNDLLKQVQAFIGKDDQEIEARLAQFYTDLNIDGSFISLGENMWGLRSWYPFDSINEEIHLDLEEEASTKKKKKTTKKAAALLDTDDDDVVGWDDDPEEDDFEEVDVASDDETATTKDDTDDDDSDDDDTDEAAKDDFEVSNGIGDDIAGLGNNVDDDYGSGDIEK